MITPMQEAAATAREWYLSFVESGFTEDQALRLVAYFIGAMAQPAETGATE